MRAWYSVADVSEITDKTQVGQTIRKIIARLLIQLFKIPHLMTDYATSAWITCKLLSGTCFNYLFL